MPWQCASPRRGEPPGMGRAESPRDAVRRGARYRREEWRRCSFDDSRSAFAQDFKHGGKYFVGRATRVDDSVALRLRRGQREVTLANAAMESQILQLESSFIHGRRCVSRSCAGQPDLLRQIEDQREIRMQSVGRPVIQPTQAIEIEKPAKALIRECRVCEAIAEDD